MTLSQKIVFLTLIFCFVNCVDLFADDSDIDVQEDEVTIKVPKGSKVIIVDKDSEQKSAPAKKIKKVKSKAKQAIDEEEDSEAEPAPIKQNTKENSKKSKRPTRSYVGTWYNDFSGVKDGLKFSSPGLMSLYLGKGWIWEAGPINMELQGNIYMPHFLVRSIGVGVYYAFCFLFTGFEVGGRCDRPAFAAGSRDAGFIDLDFLVGYKIPQTPIRFHVGPDLGFYQSGAAPRPFTFIAAKGGIGVDISERFGLDLSISHSVFMNEWMIEGLPRRVSESSFTNYSLSLVFLKGALFQD